MTVSLLVSDQSGAAISEIPIATSKVFSDFWLPLATSLNLKIVPKLHLGNEHFDQAGIRAVVDEMRLMEIEIKKGKDKASQSILGRIEQVIAGIEKVASDKNLSYDIG